MDLECRTERRDGITLVAVIVTNSHDEPARFRIENTLDGPVWPPRNAGQPAAGWDAGGYEGVLEPGESRSLGYACPASVPVESPAEAPVASSDQPAEVAWVEPAESVAAPPDSASVLRAFSDHRPPRSVLSPTPSMLGGVQRVDGAPGTPRSGDRP